MKTIRVLGAAGFLTAVLALCLAGAAHAQYQGIWKDDPTNQVHNFYMQHYATGSMVVIYTTDAVTFFAFLGNLSGTTFETDSLGPGRMHLTIVFNTDFQADATITDNDASPPMPDTFGIHKEFPAVRTVRSGIWKDPGGIFNMYAQDYQTGSTVVVYTFDGEHYQAFLGNVTDVTFGAPNLADQSIELNLLFDDSESGTAVALPVPGPGASLFSYAVEKQFAPPALDVDWQCMPQAGPAPLSVSFFDASTIGNISWFWDFGDGGTSTSPNPSYVYSAPGVYTVSLATSDGMVNVVTRRTDYITVNAGPGMVAISGTITLSSPPHSPVDNVTVTFDNGGGTTTTNASGQYSIQLPSGWTGTATPSKMGYTFVPPSRDYPVAVTSDQTNQDFDAIAPIPSPIVVYTGGDDQTRADVAWNFHHNQYLVVWHNDRPITQDVYATRVTTGGQVLAWFAVSTGSNCKYPAAAYNGQRNEYLVVWQQLNTGVSPQKWEIYGRIIDYDKPGTNAPFLIAAWTSYDLQVPKVAWNGFRNEYMVVWQTSHVTSGNLLGIGRRRLGGDGSLVSNADYITSGGGLQGFPDITYNVAADDYLVVWSLGVGPGNADIQGGLLEYDGSLKGSAFGIATGALDQQNPAVATNEQDAFMVSWQTYYLGDWDIRAQRLNVNGAPVGNERLVANTPDDETASDVAAVGGGTEYMFVWERATAGGVSIELGRYDTATSQYNIFEVSAAGLGNNANPAVGSHNSGFFVVYEYTSALVGADSDIFGELY